MARQFGLRFGDKRKHGKDAARLGVGSVQPELELNWHVRWNGWNVSQGTDDRHFPGAAGRRGLADQEITAEKAEERGDCCDPKLTFCHFHSVFPSTDENEHTAGKWEFKH